MTSEESTSLIQQLDHAREKMRAVLAEIDRRAELYPAWTIKEVLAHIAGWDDAALISLRAYQAGDAPAIPAARGINPYNAQTVAERASLIYEQIVQEYELTRQQLKDLLLALPPEKLREPYVFPWPGQGTIAQMIQVLIEHEEEHVEDIRKRMQL